MIQDQSILSPFKWYSSPGHQERYRKGCNGDCIPDLIAPHDRLLPFQIRIPLTAGDLDIIAWDINSECGAQQISLFQMANTSLLEITQDDTHHIIKYYGSGVLFYPGAVPLDLPDRAYYSVLSTNKGTYYSEIFMSKKDLSGHIKLEWWNLCDFGGISFAGGYKHRAYLEDVLLPPRVELEQEEEKDGYGNPVPTLQRFLYTYRLANIEIQHSLATAIATIPMHKYREITLADGRSTTMELVRVEPEYLDCGAQCTLEFSEQVLIKTACC